MADFDRFRINDGGYVIQHLLPGAYDIYVYSWRGSNDQGTPGIVVSAPGGPYGLSIASGQPWPGQQVLGVTYGVVRIDLGANGTFGISGFAGGEGTAPINGIQIVPVPAPGAAILGPLAGLAFTRRRRGGGDRERSAVG